MHELDLTSLRLFAAVCETRNIARAAEQHHIVASAVSKRLAQLEGVAGDILLEHARALLAGADRVAREMSWCARCARARHRWAVCWNAADLEGLQTRPYRSDHLALVMPAAHPLARCKHCSFEDMRRQPVTRGALAGGAPPGVRDRALNCYCFDSLLGRRSARCPHILFEKFESNERRWQMAGKAGRSGRARRRAGN